MDSTILVLVGVFVLVSLVLLVTVATRPKRRMPTDGEAPPEAEIETRRSKPARAPQDLKTAPGKPKPAAEPAPDGAARPSETGTQPSEGGARASEAGTQPSEGGPRPSEGGTQTFPEAAAQPSAEPDRSSGPIGIVAEPQAEPAAEPEPVAEVVPISRLARGLARTKDALGRRLAVVARREKMDEDDWEEVEAALIAADVGISATTRIVDSLREAKPMPSQLASALKGELVGILEKGQPELQVRESGVTVWLVTGVNGVGKTTSIAKLTRRLQSEGRTVVLAAADTFRAAAIDQLGTWAGRLGVHMVKHAPGADPGAVIYDAIEHAKAKGIDVVIADTAGRLHTKSNLMDELKKMRRIADSQADGVAETLLVIDATVGQNGIAQARSFGEAIEVTGLILTKLDGSAKGGIVIAVQEELGIPVKAVGVGEGMDDLEPFVPGAFVDALTEGV